MENTHTKESWSTTYQIEYSIKADMYRVVMTGKAYGSKHYVPKNTLAEALSTIDAFLKYDKEKEPNQNVDDWKLI